MKKPHRLISLLLALCMAAHWFVPMGIAAEGGTVHTVSDLESVLDLLAQDKVKDGDTIQVMGIGGVQMSGEAPWIIDKNVTITGGDIVIRGNGILLDADVTFKDTTLTFTSNVRNAIMANGHTLTLENVACGGHSFNLFCGGLLKSSYETFEVPTPGNMGTLHIKGSTTLQKNDTYGPGNIYAGNLCMGGMDAANNGPEDNGPANVFTGRAVINIEGGGDVGTVYACGAQQRIPEGAPNGKVTRPDAARYTVSGSVTVRGNAPDVEGAGAKETHVVYQNNSGNEISRVFSNLSSLSVKSGVLALAAGSHHLDGVVVSLADGAKLSLKALAGRVPALGDFTGGGILILDKSQTLPINGTVTGTTKVAVDWTNYDNTQSTTLPTQGWCYIQAPKSQDDAFALLPYATQPDMKLVPSGNGNWTIPAAGESNAKLVSLAPANMTAESGATEADVPLNTTDSGDGFYTGIENIPLILRVNGNEAADKGDGNYEVAGLWLCVGTFDFDVGEALEVTVPTSSDEDSPAPIPDNIYRIEIVVPGAYTASGTNLTASFTLTVGDVTAVPIPQANPGLVWTGAEQTGVSEGPGYILTGHKASNAGTYTATAALESGYRWEDGTAEDKTIPWSIAKAAAPAAPAGLAGVAPTTSGGTDGKITGTTAEMEYSASAVFSAPKSCGMGETAGLTAGTYYVRVKGNPNRMPGEIAQVTVPAFVEPDPDHRHSWSGDWSANATHHWHNCMGENCPIQEESQKDGYAAHTAGEWITDKAPTATQDGSRHRSCTVCGHETARETIPATGETPDHRHSWSGDWSANATHHWHNCMGENCPIQEESQKDGYAAHTPGEWVIDKAPTATQDGSRHRSCTVCGHETARETIPATGGGSSSGGGGSSGGSSSGSSSSSGSGSGSNTVKNPDGSTTTTKTDKRTGTVTETTKRPDGSKTVVETQKDGTVTTTDTVKDGSTVTVVAHPDGPVETTVKQADGLTASLTAHQGNVQAEVWLPARKDPGAALTLPIPALPGDNAELSIHTGSSQPVRVEVPVEGGSVTTVACLVEEDGTERILKTAAVDDGRITLRLSDEALVRFRDGGRSFDDIETHWGEEAVRFVTARELFLGKTDSAFDPDGAMTRAMLTVVLARLDGVDAAGGTAYETGMSWAVDRGISDGRDPGQPVTREQFITMLYRYAGSPAVTAGELPFRDGAKVSGYARDAVRWATENGILSGFEDGSVLPQDRATRAQAAMILVRYVDYLNHLN